MSNDMGNNTSKPLILVGGDIKEIGVEAAERFIGVIKKYPDAVIILPTGTTPLPMYHTIVRRFKNEPAIDFSGVRFFNLDEYIGLPEDHPLSYHFYMKKVFYDRLNEIGRTRAPKSKNIYFLQCIEKMQSEEATLREAEKKTHEYEEKLEHAIKATGRKKADLVVLGVGGAYPVFDKEGKFICLKGGHIGFNEAGSKQSDRVRVIKLSGKTRFDTKFRFDNLKYCSDTKKEYNKEHRKDYTAEVPKYAMTLGIANILKSNKILLLASGEEKAPVIKAAYEKRPTPDFPVTFLKKHRNVYWIVDKDAAHYLPHIRMPWKVGKVEWSWTLIRQAVLEWLSANCKLNIEDLTSEELAKLDIPMKVIEQFGGLESIKQDAKSFLYSTLRLDHTDKLPQRGKKVLIFSPHPDDDVTTMAATISILVKRGCKVTIVYLTSGEDSVRDNDKKAEEMYKKYRRLFITKHKGLPSREEDDALLRKAKIEVRHHEGYAATRKLGLSERNAIFLDLSYYYRRGLVDFEIAHKVISKNDVDAVCNTLNKINPNYIFYSAEIDPHGTHGLGAEIIKRALRNSRVSKDIKIWQYRGAWQEWPLYQEVKNLVIMPFSQDLMDLKISAVKAHASQLKPMFPGSDPRKFYERARDRNRETGRKLEQLGYLPIQKTWYAEVFRISTYGELSKFVQEAEAL